MFDKNPQNGSSCLSFVAKLFVKEAQYAQITKLEALNACESVSTKLKLNAEFKNYLFDTLIENKILIPLSTNIYLIHDNSVQVVLLNFTACYSPFCKPGANSCYSPSCPNKNKPLVSNDTSILPVSVLNTLNCDERSRQLAIEAFKNSEQLFLNKLVMMRDSFSLPLLQSHTTIEESRRSSFHDALFGNYQILATHHKKIIKELESSRTHGLYPIFIGDLLLPTISKLKDPYLRYVSNHSFATHHYTLEYNRNSAFASLIDQQDIPLKDLLALPLTHMPRCLSLLTNILEHSSNDTALEQSVELITDLLQSMEEATRTAEAEQRLLEIRQSQPSVPDDLVFEGTADLLLPTSVIECHLMLFRHALWITRQTTNSYGETEYVLIDQPIPLAMVSLQQPVEMMDSDDASIATIYTLSGFRIRYRIKRIKQRMHDKKTKKVVVRRGPSPVVDPKWLQIGHFADPHVTYTFACVNRLEWIKQIKSVLPDPESGPFKLCLQCTFHEPVLCSLPIGDDQLVLGTRSGIWISDKQVMNEPCHQLALFNNRIVLARLTNRVLAALDNNRVHILQRSVIHFTTGTFKNEPILCYLRRRRTSGSVQLVLMDARLKKRKQYKPQLMNPAEVIVANDCIYIRSSTEGVEKVSIVSWMMGSTDTGKKLPCPTETTVMYVPLDHHGALVCSPTYAYPAVEQEDADTVQQGIAFDSKAKKVVVWYPYLIVFSLFVIEIRHLETTELVQVIPGNKIKCLYVALPVIHVSMMVSAQTKIFRLELKEPCSYEDEIQ